MSKTKWEEVVARDKARRREVAGTDKEPKWPGTDAQPHDPAVHVPGGGNPLKEKKPGYHPTKEQG